MPFSLPNQRCQSTESTELKRYPAILLLQCCAVLYGASASSVQTAEATVSSEHCGTNRSAGTTTVATSTTAGTVRLVASLPTTIDYKLAVLTYKILHTSITAYLSYHIRPGESTRHLRSSTTPLLHRPTTRTHFVDRVLMLCSCRLELSGHCVSQ